MNEAKKSCIHCGESIQLAAVKCRYCREWLKEESVKVDIEDESTETTVEEFADSEVAPNIKRKKFSWFKPFMLLLFVSVVLGTLFYEKNAYRIIVESQRFEQAKSYNAAVLGYRVVIEKFPFSYFTIKAKKHFSRIEKRADSGIVKMKIGGLEGFDPYKTWVLPLLLSFVCAAIFLLLFLYRLFVGRRFSLLSLVFFVASSWMAVVHLTQLNVFAPWSLLHISMYRDVYDLGPEPVFLGCYLLAIIGMIMVMKTKKRK